jgi:hypothetical protein
MFWKSKKDKEVNTNASKVWKEGENYDAFYTPKTYHHIYLKEGNNINRIYFVSSQKWNLDKNYNPNETLEKAIKIDINGKSRQLLSNNINDIVLLVKKGNECIVRQSEVTNEECVEITYQSLTEIFTKIHQSKKMFKKDDIQKLSNIVGFNVYEAFFWVVDVTKEIK